MTQFEIFIYPNFRKQETEKRNEVKRRMKER